MAHRPSCLILTLLLAACTTSPPGAIPAGQYGSGQTRLTVGAAGIQFAHICDYGTIDGEIALDDQGRFDVSGWFSRDMGAYAGPAVPARYSGAFTGSFVYLKVILPANAGADTVGPFVLPRDGASSLPGCL